MPLYLPKLIFLRLRTFPCTRVLFFFVDRQPPGRRIHTRRKDPALQIGMAPRILFFRSRFSHLLLPGGAMNVTQGHGGFVLPPVLQACPLLPSFPLLRVHGLGPSPQQMPRQMNGFPRLSFRVLPPQCFFKEVLTIASQKHPFFLVFCL